jgi:hypothetical protein
MQSITREQAPVQVTDGAFEYRAKEIGGEMSASFGRFPAGTDLRPAFAGLPDDLCQCPHWGYVISGTIRMHTLDGAEDYVAGQAFYWGPGHAPEAVEDTEIVEFSPTGELDHTLDHVRGSA